MRRYQLALVIESPDPDANEIDTANDIIDAVRHVGYTPISGSLYITELPAPDVTLTPAKDRRT